jgi:hypothetical protein
MDSEMTAKIDKKSRDEKELRLAELDAKFAPQQVYPGGNPPPTNDLNEREEQAY